VAPSEYDPADPPAETEASSGADRARPVAVELRRRRELLGISQAEAARRTKVARTVINEIERGRRIPSIPTWQALREGLGMLPPPTVLLTPAAPADLTEAHLRRLSARVIVAGGAALADVAAALGISIPAVREGLLVIGERFAAVGLRLVEDGVTVRVAPAADVEAAVTELTTVDPIDELSAEQLSTIAIVAYLGTATRRQIESIRGEDSETLLRRLVERGFLERVQDEAALGAPNVYRVSAKALAAIGYHDPESLQTFVADVVDAADLCGYAGKLLGQGDDDHGVDVSHAPDRSGAAPRG
jgi:segregation and condensation protein B